MPVFETARGSRMQIVVPRTEWPELEKAKEDYGRLLQERKVTGSRVSALQRDREKTERADATALAKWLKEGKKGKEPESKEVEKIDKEIAACERRLVALEEALDDAEADLIEVVDEHRSEWKPRAEKELESAYAVYAEVVEALARAHEAVSAKLGLRSWLRDFPEEASYKPRGMLLPALRAPHGDPYMFDEVMAALRADVQAQLTDGARAPLSALQGATQQIHEERLANEQTGRGYFTDDELRHLAENEATFQHGAGVKIITSQGSGKKRTGPPIVDGALFVAPEGEDE